MGRGRAKAKQTKVARKLKYSTGHTDLSQLADELGAASPGAGDRVDDADETAEPARDDDELITKYADYADDGDGARRR
ncbi:MAG: DUF3073 domain-containing protein [Streptosporangiales bacterium]